MMKETMYKIRLYESATSQVIERYFENIASNQVCMGILGVY